jgi:hypothetical protein
VFFEHGVSLLLENFERKKGGIKPHGNCFQRQLSAFIPEWLLSDAFVGFLRLVEACIVPTAFSASINKITEFTEIFKQNLEGKVP